MPKIYSKLIFKRLLLTLITENTFMFVSKFYKQTDACTMGGPISVALSYLYVTNTEKEVSDTSQPKFCKHFVNDIINTR